MASRIGSFRVLCSLPRMRSALVPHRAFLRGIKNQSGRARSIRRRTVTPNSGAEASALETSKVPPPPAAQKQSERAPQPVYAQQPGFLGLLAEGFAWGVGREMAFQMFGMRPHSYSGDAESADPGTSADASSYAAGGSEAYSAPETPQTNEWGDPVDTGSADSGWSDFFGGDGGGDGDFWEEE
eukprot:scaffold58_cov256-Pinguiococcus_pyrenoidosus.AAC.17